MTTFSEKDHPRGQATNAGQFRTKENRQPGDKLVAPEATAVNETATRFRRFGPNTIAVVKFVETFPTTVTVDQWSEINAAANVAAQDTRWEAACNAARAAAQQTPGLEAALYAAGDACADACYDIVWADARVPAWSAKAIIVRDLISDEHFDVLTAPMRAAGFNFDKLG